MHHEIRIDGKVFRIRPVTLDDAVFITQLRSNPKHARYLHGTTNLSDQTKWLTDYFQRPGDYYFVVERKKTAQREGTIAVYGQNATKGKISFAPDRKCAIWGRWLIQPDSMAAVESAFLIYQAAFEVLGLDMLYFHVIQENTQVVLFHKLSGLVTCETLLPNHQQVGEVTFDSIEFTVSRETWETRKAAFESRVILIARTFYPEDFESQGRP